MPDSNMNSLRNKITYLRAIIKVFFLQISKLVLRETKVDESFLNAQINVVGYEIRARSDRNKYVGVLLKFVRRVLICKLRECEPKFIINAFFLNLLCQQKTNMLQHIQTASIKPSFNVFRRSNNISKQNKTGI